MCGFTERFTELFDHPEHQLPVKLRLVDAGRVVRLAVYTCFKSLC